MTPAHVLIVGDYAALTGGQAKVAIDSARLLADAGLGVTFFAAVGPPDPALRHPGIDVRCLGQSDLLGDPSRLRASLRGIWNGAAADALRRLAGRFDPARTVLHAHGFAKALSPAVGPVLTRGPLRTVFTLHEYFLACPNGGFFDYRRGEICREVPLGRGCLARNCDARHPAHKAWRVTRQAALHRAGDLPRGLRDVIYLSRTQRRVLAPHVPAGVRWHHVPNPVDRSSGPRVNARANGDFVFVGRLAPEKGPALFAAAARAAGVRAVFVGDGPERAAVRAANPEAKITGWRDRAGVAAALRRARALVFPSLWHECQPLAPQEAVALGVPVIAGAWTAAAEALRPNRTGLVVERPTVEAFTGAIASLKGEHPLFEAIAAEPPPPRDDHAERLVAVYRSVLAAEPVAA